LTCKFGKWYETNPQRGRANNSAVLLRGNICPTSETIGKEEFLELWKKVELSNSGEPGFYFTDNKELGTNPCCEISLNSFQFCNLVEINASDIKDQQDLIDRTIAAAFIGDYTGFLYRFSLSETPVEKGNRKRSIVRNRDDRYCKWSSS
jgi:ribonucleoside-triphosphate reductase (thioredoxin)